MLQTWMMQKHWCNFIQAWCLNLRVLGSPSGLNIILLFWLLIKCTVVLLSMGTSVSAGEKAGVYPYPTDTYLPDSQVDCIKIFLRALQMQKQRVTWISSEPKGKHVSAKSLQSTLWVDTLILITFAWQIASLWLHTTAHSYKANSPWALYEFEVEKQSESLLSKTFLN